jgi:hypothetical protein
VRSVTDTRQRDAIKDRRCRADMDAMASFLSTLLRRSPTPTRLELAQLQLELLVAMAIVDDRVHVLETDHLYAFVEHAAGTPADHQLLLGRLEELLEEPPNIDELLDELEQHAQHASFGRAIVGQLTQVADSDNVIDHREEFLLDLVCDVFGLPPVSLGRDVEDVHDLQGLVHKLAQGRGAA